MAEFAARIPAQNVKVVGLIGAGHFFSHFFQLVLPPLFPVLKDDFGVSYAELGLLMTVFYATSGLAQTPAGFLVDRFGARIVLFLGLGLLSVAVALFALAPGYEAMLGLIVLAGLGNSVFHPADYAILTARVGKPLLARAYSVHTLGGNLGWAAAPAVVLLLTGAFGSWRLALLAVGLAGLLMTLCLATAGGLEAEERRRSVHADTGSRPGDVGVLLTPPVLLCFVYFALLSTALIGIQNFMPSALNLLHETPLAVASAGLTAFLVGGAVGVLVGGILADRWQRHELVVTQGLFISAALVLLVGAVDLGALGLTVILAVAGFAYSLTIPSRDMLVRGATPPGSTGKVFGFVYSGLDLGSAVTPAMLGLLLDHGRPGLVFVTIAVAVVLTVLSALTLQRVSAAARRSAG